MEKRLYLSKKDRKICGVCSVIVIISNKGESNEN